MGLRGLLEAFKLLPSDFLIYSKILTDTAFYRITSLSSYLRLK